MIRLSRIAIAVALAVGAASATQAQSRRDYPADADYRALAIDRGVVPVERAPRFDATVPPSTSHTVMGLSVPR